MNKHVLILTNWTTIIDILIIDAFYFFEMVSFTLWFISRVFGIIVEEIIKFGKGQILLRLRCYWFLAYFFSISRGLLINFLHKRFLKIAAVWRMLNSFIVFILLGDCG